MAKLAGRAFVSLALMSALGCATSTGGDSDARDTSTLELPEMDSASADTDSGAGPAPVDTGSEDTDPAPAQTSCRASLLAQGDDWQLIREDGQPFFIQGAGGTEHMELAALAGANTLRTWGASDDTTALLDEAWGHGLCVIVGLWMGHASDGFDYDDADAVAEQRASLLSWVELLKDHPAVLMWGVGNESEIDNDSDAYWSALGDLAAAIEAIDPERPRAAVTAESGDDYAQRLTERAPAIDVWGINSYGGLSGLGERVASQGWEGPWFVAEYGPSGPWESSERTGAEKASVYTERHETIAAFGGGNLGGLAFAWRSAEHPTETWFPLFRYDGRSTAAVDALQEAWGGEALSGRAPEVTGVVATAAEAAGASWSAELEAVDPEGGALSATWILATDSEAVDNEPFTETCRVLDETSLTVAVTTPHQPGPWRLIGWAEDDAGQVSMATHSFEVQASEDVPEGMIALPLWVGDHFSASGHMGDHEGLVSGECEASSDPCAPACRSWTWTPKSKGWVGVYWQYPANNWGSEVGLSVAPGATAITFEAWADRDGVTASFFAGLSDDFRVSMDDVALTATPTRYSLDLSASTYEAVIGAFGWSTTTPADGQPVTLSIRDLQWEN